MIKNLFYKNSLLLILCFFTFLNTAIAQGRKKTDKETHEWRYEVEAVGIGIQGTYQIKVWTYSKNAKIAIEQATKNAVHAIIFKGFPNKGRIQGQKPLVRNPNIEQEKAKFFKVFFKDGGKFQKYVFLANNGAIALGDRIKIRKRSYKIGVVVSVNVAGLRKYLEEVAIIKTLSSGF